MCGIQCTFMLPDSPAHLKNTMQKHNKPPFHACVSDVCEVSRSFKGPLCVLHVGVMAEDALEMLTSNGHTQASSACLTFFLSKAYAISKEVLSLPSILDMLGFISMKDSKNVYI